MVKPGLWMVGIRYPVVLIVAVLFGGFAFGPVPVPAQAQQPASQFPQKYKIVKELNFGPFGKEPASASQIVLDESNRRLFIAYRSSSLVAVVDNQTQMIVAYLDFRKKVTQLALNQKLQQLCATHLEDHAVSVFDLARNTVSATIPEIESPVWLDIDSQTDEILIKSNDQIFVIDGQAHRVTRTFSLPESNYGPFRINPNRKHLYFGKEGQQYIDGFDQDVPATLFVIDYTTGQTITTQSLAGFIPGAIIYEETTNLVLVQSGVKTSLLPKAEVTVLSASDYSVVNTYQTDGEGDLEFDPSLMHIFTESYLADGCEGAELVVRDARTGTYLRSIPTGLGFPTDFVASPKTNQLFCTTGNQELLVIDGTALTVMISIAIKQDFIDVATSPQSNTVYALGSNRNLLEVIDGRTNESISQIQLPGLGHSLEFVPEKNRLYVYSLRGPRCRPDQFFSVIDCTTNTLRFTIQLDGFYGQKVISNQGQIYCVAPEGIRVIDGTTGQILARLSIEGYKHLVFHPKVNRVFVLSEVYDSDHSTLFAIDGQTHQILNQTTFTGDTFFFVRNLFANPSTNQLYLIGESDKADFIFVGVDGLTLKIEKFQEVQSVQPFDLVFSGLDHTSNQILLVDQQSPNSQVWSFDLQTSRIKLISQLNMNFFFHKAFVLAPQRSRLFIHGGRTVSSALGERREGSIYVIDTSRGKVISETITPEIYPITWNSTTKTLYGVWGETVMVFRKTKPAASPYAPRRSEPAVND